MSQVWDKEKIWVSDRIRTYDLPNTGRALYPLELRRTHGEPGHTRSRKQRARRVFFSQKTRKLFPLEIYVLCWTYWTIQLSPCRRYWYCSLMIPWWGKPWLEGRIIPKRIPWSFERGTRIEVQILRKIRKWSNISGTVLPKFESLKFNTLRSKVKKF